MWKLGKLKLVFILANGKTLTVKCKSFEMTKLSSSKGKRELKIDKADRHWAIDLDEVVGFTARRVLF